MTQTRRMLVAVLASVAVFYIWMLLANRLGLVRPPTPTTQPVASTAPAETPLATATQPGSAPATSAGGELAATQPSLGARPVAYQVTGGQNDQAITIGGAEKDSSYPMSVELLPRGASIGNVYLRGYYQTVARKQPYRLLQPVIPPDGDALSSFQTAKIRFENYKLDVPLGDAVWALSPESTDARKIFTVDVKTADGKPLARITKTYELPKQPPKARGEPGTYDLNFSLGLQNLSGAPLSVIVVQQGPVGFRQEEHQREDRRVIAATWRDDKLTATGHMRTDVVKKKTIDMAGDAENHRIAWAAGTNKYFTAIMTPADRTGSKVPARYSAVEAVDLGDLEENAITEVSAMTFQYVTLPQQIPSGGSEQLAFKLYLGPKSKRAFQNIPEYAQLDYYWVIRESFYACAPAGLVALMMTLLGAFHAIPPHNYGVAIIILVLVVRTILHPITKKSQVNMLKMQKQMAGMQPKIEAIKQKYANDKAQLNQAMMEVYREAGVNPAGQFLSCLPMMLQIPIWGALYAALASTIEMRHAPFDGYWIKDLTSQDAVYTFAHPIYVPLVSYLLGGPIMSINILPMLLAFSQFLQAKYMPRSGPAPQPGAQADQMEQQRKMMMFMSLIFVLFFYNAPSGLNLYIMASNLFGILEQWRIRQHLAQLEHKKPAAAGVGAGDLGEASVKRAPDKPRQPSWLERKWQDLQKAAEEAQRIESQKRKKK